ncbi:MAG: nucleotidyltransferase family protein [Lachnospiraceae bacterium]|nr:nucleotidyltransferase family protein [Lachnospiraceae bacterium]
MSTVGIIAEFNPFHNGHRYLIEEAKRQTGADTAIIIMSGDFVQRGEPAICDKYLRTRFALENGADIVFELPVRYATGSAAIFAEGAVSLLASTNAVDYLAFGSECGDIELIKKTAETLEKLEGSAEFKEKLADYLKAGLSFPSARTKAVEAVTADTPILNSPNNILAVEYCRALFRLKDSGHKLPKAVTISRIGAGYSDAQPDNSDYPSATAVRNLLCNSDTLTDIFNRILPPSVSASVIANKGLCLPVISDDFSDIFFTRLNTLSDDYLRSISNINPDLMNSILNYRGCPVKILEMTAAIKSKAFTYTAISRAITAILLSTPAVNSIAINPGTDKKKPYLRLLGFNKASSNILKAINKSGDCVIINKMADADRTNPLFLQDILAADIYSQVLYSKFGCKRAGEYCISPIII